LAEVAAWAVQCLPGPCCWLSIPLCQIHLLAELPLALAAKARVAVVAVHHLPLLYCSLLKAEVRRCQMD